VTASTSPARAADGSLPLARLLAIAYRQLITDLNLELGRRGWTDVRPAYGFALLWGMCFAKAAFSSITAKPLAVQNSI